MATVYGDFIPKDVSRQVIASLGDSKSAVMQLARVIPMPAGLESIPTVSVAPVAAFVSPAYGGRKPASGIEWTAQVITPEELAVTLAIPNAFLLDAGFPVWESVREEIAKAFARAFDAAALYGTGAPASFPAGGLTAAAFAAAQTGVAVALDSLNGALNAVEALGLEADGMLGGPGLRGVMRAAQGAFAAPTEAPASQFYGIPYATTTRWVPGTTPFDLALVGAFQNVVIGIREDIRFDLSTDGVLSDGAGVVTLNAFQADSTLMRAYMRVGMAVGLPLRDVGGTAKPFALAQTTVAFGSEGPTESRPSKSSRKSAKSKGEPEDEAEGSADEG